MAHGWRWSALWAVTISDGAALEALRGDGVGVGAVRRLDAPTGCAAIGLDTEGRNQIMVASGANALVSADMVPDELLDRAGVVLARWKSPPRRTGSFCAGRGTPGQ